MSKTRRDLLKLAAFVPATAVIPDILSSEEESQGGVTKEMNRLTEVIQEDPEYAFGWHCNLKMSMFDAFSEKCALLREVQLEIAEEGAQRFMKLCFGVDTSSDMLNR